MHKAGFKIFLPLVAILYCIAFFEIEIGGVQQTWGDEFDTYVTASHSYDLNSIYRSVDHKPTRAFLQSFLSSIVIPSQTAPNHLRDTENPVSHPFRLFAMDCCWLL